MHSVLRTLTNNTIGISSCQRTKMELRSTVVIEWVVMAGLIMTLQKHTKRHKVKPSDWYTVTLILANLTHCYQYPSVIWSWLQSNCNFGYIYISYMYTYCWELLYLLDDSWEFQFSVKYRWELMDQTNFFREMWYHIRQCVFIHFNGDKFCETRDGNIIIIT